MHYELTKVEAGNWGKLHLTHTFEQIAGIEPIGVGEF
jgi:hypothetical protein